MRRVARIAVIDIGTNSVKLHVGERRVGDVWRTIVDRAEVTRLGRRSRGRAASFDLVVESTGSPEGMPRALELVKPRGTIVWKSTHHAPAKFDAAPLVVNEVTVVGSRCGRFEPALELLASGRVRVRDLVSEELPLSKGVAALRLAAKRGVRKVLLRADA